MKELSDKLVAAYDQTNRLKDSDEDAILDNESQVDPFNKEKQFKEESLTTLSTSGFNNSFESDPMSLTRNLNGSTNDFELNQTTIEMPKLDKVDLSNSFSQEVPDFSSIESDFKKIPEIESPSFDNINLNLDPPSFDSFDIKI